jgi:hypothetical protein
MCRLLWMVVCCMIWTDKTCPYSFSNLKVRPIYLFLANISKYLCGKPTSLCAHHVGYLPQLPPWVQDTLKKLTGKVPNNEVIKFVKRQLFQVCWAVLLLDPKFCCAYFYRIVVLSADGIWRRVFPRFFTYLANYPEKCITFICMTNIVLMSNLQSNCCLSQGWRVLSLYPMLHQDVGNCHDGHISQHGCPLGLNPH